MIAHCRNPHRNNVKIVICRRFGLHGRDLDFNQDQDLRANFRTQQFGNDEISKLCKQGKYGEAFEAFEKFTRTNFKVTPATYARLVQASAHLKSVEHGRRVHYHLLKCGDPPDVVLRNHIVNMYGKCGDMENARLVFDEMPKRNLVSWTAIIAAYSQHRDGEEAVQLYRRMRQEGVMPDTFVLANMVRACSVLLDMELGRQIHGHCIKSEDGFGPLVQNALVTMYAKCNVVQDAGVVFHRIHEKDMISWSSLIAGLSQNEFEKDALSVFKKMLSAGECVNGPIFGSILKACSSCDLEEEGRQIHGLSVKCGFSNDSVVGCSLTGLYAKCGDLRCAWQAFYYILKPDRASWNAIIDAYAYNQRFDGVTHLFSLMRSHGMEPDFVTVLCLLNSCRNSASLILGEEVHSYIVKSGFDMNINVCNALITMYNLCSNLNDAFVMFNSMNKHDRVSWNAIMDACVHHDQLDDVFRLFRLMHISETRPDTVTVITCLSSSSRLAAMELGIQVHAYEIKLGFDCELSVANGLIDMYAKCGVLESASKIFRRMAKPDVVTWSSLIVGYAQFGSAQEALSLFEEMVELGLNPNSATMVGVLSACSRVGLIEEGYNHYRTMRRTYGIVPTKAHGSCMVDLLGRAGRLSEAVDFINEMNHEPDTVMWKSLLSACRLHGNLSIGRKVAERILQLEPSNSSAFVLLSNMYASSSSWEDVAKLRKSMRKRGIKKDPGRSWTKVKDKMSVFVAEDRSHVQMEEIYAMLDDLYIQMEGLYLSKPECTLRHLMA